MSYNYCYIIIRNGKAVKEMYTDEIRENPDIRYKWTNQNYEALPFLRKPEPHEIPPQSDLVELLLQTFFYIEREDGIPTLKRTIPKPYNAPNEYETINVTKKSFKQKLLEQAEQKRELIEQLKLEIDALEKESQIINYLELESDE